MVVHDNIESNEGLYLLHFVTSIFARIYRFKRFFLFFHEPCLSLSLCASKCCTLSDISPSTKAKIYVKLKKNSGRSIFDKKMHPKWPEANKTYFGMCYNKNLIMFWEPKMLGLHYQKNAASTSMQRPEIHDNKLNCFMLPGVAPWYWPKTNAVFFFCIFSIWNACISVCFLQSR